MAMRFGSFKPVQSAAGKRRCVRSNVVVAFSPFLSIGNRGQHFSAALSSTRFREDLSFRFVARYIHGLICEVTSRAKALVIATRRMISVAMELSG